MELDKTNIRNNDRLEEFKIAFNISALKLIGPLFPIFWIADLLYSPENSMLFLSMRLTIPAYCFTLYYFSRKIENIKKIEYLSYALITYPSVVVTAISTIAGGVGSVYFFGLNLIAAGAICFFPWTMKQLPFVVACTYGSYFASIFFVAPDIQEIKKFIVNLFFISGTIIISVVIRYIYEVLKYKEIDLRLALNNEIENRNLIIVQKTNEAVQLSTLSKQFSPQVVQAIHEGRLDLAGSTRRSSICTIFIDIVNSTERVARIDKEDLNTVLSMFMSDTMKILLKYDITIDKFLGDGVLAFSNSPIQRNDYVKRVVEAAIEIKARIAQNREAYVDLWRKELEIKIGIDVGYANVGFYGSKEYFKSYTAIGSVVNLSSRLCSMSEPNQILITHDVYKHIKDDPEFRFNHLGPKPIRGFESEIIKVTEVTSNKEYIDSNIAMCPNDHGVLALDVDEQGLYVFKCRICSYKLKDEIYLDNKKAS